MVNYTDRVVCTNDVVMQGTSDLVFVSGKEYKGNTTGIWIHLINEFGEKHCVGRFSDEDKFFKNHFKLINEG